VVSRLANALSEDNDVLIMTFPTERMYPLSDKIRVYPFHEPTNTILDIFGQGRPGFIKGFKRRYTYVKQLKMIMRRERPDVTISFLDNPNFLNAMAGGCGIKIMSERNNPKYKGKRYFLRECFSFFFADKVVFQTNTIKNMFPFWIRRKGVVIPNPVHVSCAAIGGRKKIVTMGRIHPQKNHVLLIRAFSEFVKIHPSYTLHIYGKYDLGDNLEEIVEKMGLAGKVFLEGFRDDVHEAISDAEQFVLSSEYEGTPNALLEAMMMGLPCISTDFEGAREMMGGCDACLLTPVGDVKALLEAMCRFADNELLRKEYARRGTEFAQVFSEDKVLPQWRGLFCQ